MGCGFSTVGFGFRLAASVSISFESQRILSERRDQRFIVGRDHHDPGIGDRVAAAIFFFVESDQCGPRNQDIAVDDGAADARVASDAHAWHQYAVFDATEAVYAD